MLHRLPRGVLVALRGAGLDIDDLARRAGLAPAELEQPLSAEATDRLLALAAAELPPWFGLVAGSEVQPELFGAVGFAAMSSATFGAALTKLARYKRMMTRDELSFAPRRGHTLVRIRVAASGPYRRLKLDFELAFLLGFGRRFTRRPIRPLRVMIDLSRPPPDHAARYALFDCPVAFDRPSSAIAFDDADLAAPLVSADADLAAMFGDLADRQRRDAEDRRETAGRVRAALRTAMRGALPTLTEIAGKLGTSERQLQRRLRDDGRSFRQLLDDVRSELARDHLRNAELDTAEISFLLGFSHPNSFFRAFKRWTRSTPESYRSRLATAPAPRRRARPSQSRGRA